MLPGPMALRLHVEVRGGDDAHLFAGVRKFREGREITFEGSYGFERDLVAKGWLVASHREADPELSLPGMPVHAHSTRRPFAPDEVAPLDIALLPSATLYRAGDTLRLDIQGRWFSRPGTRPVPGLVRTRSARGDGPAHRREARVSSARPSGAWALTRRLGPPVVAVGRLRATWWRYGVRPSHIRYPRAVEPGRHAARQPYRGGLLESCGVEDDQVRAFARAVGDDRQQPPVVFPRVVGGGYEDRLAGLSPRMGWMSRAWVRVSYLMMVSSPTV